MKVSENALSIIKHYESLHDGDLSEIGLQPKMCPAGTWTEGYGHVILDDKNRRIEGPDCYKRARKFSKIQTKEEAERILMRDLVQFEAIVSRNVSVVLKQHEFDALVSHTYNTGGSETLFELVNNSSDEAVISWIKNRYITANGKKLRGLVLRRESEAILFETGKLNF